MARGEKIEVALVLQGGGALGAYESGAVSALLELMDHAQAQRQDVALKAVSGVSIGAINAACVVGAANRPDARRRLAALWNDLTLQVPEFVSRIRLDLSAFGLPSIDPARDLALLGLPGFYIPRGDLLNFPNWTSYYDTNPFLVTLRRHIDFDALNASATRFIVSAVDVESGILTRFRNHPVTAAENQKKEDARAAAPLDRHEAIKPRHVLASGSLPPQFPWTTIAGAHYWDGGIADNTPLGDVMDAFSTDDDVRRLLVVMNLYPLTAKLPRNLREVEDRVHELSYGNRVRQDREGAERINRLVETIQELAALVGNKRLPTDLRQKIDKAKLYKVVEAIEIDLQNADAAGGQQPFDDAGGLRDFSPAIVDKRRRVGHALALRKLEPIFGKPRVRTAAATASGSAR
jgi:NTE family protein